MNSQPQTTTSTQEKLRQWLPPLLVMAGCIAVIGFFLTRNVTPDPLPVDEIAGADTNLLVFRLYGQSPGERDEDLLVYESAPGNYTAARSFSDAETLRELLDDTSIELTAEQWQVLTDIVAEWCASPPTYEPQPAEHLLDVGLRCSETGQANRRLELPARVLPPPMTELLHTVPSIQG